MSIKRTLRQPREHLSDDFWKTILSHTLDESEARLKDGLDRIHGLQPNQFINGGFRQFASVPRSKLESANPKLWESAKVQKLVIDTWIESALEVRTRSFDYFTVLGYLIPEEAFGNDYYSSTIAEHVIRSDHGQVQIICDERWPYLDSDTITAVALAYGLIPNLETHDESSPSISIAHIPTRIQSLSGRAANLRARYAEGFDDVWPDDVVIPTGLIDSLQSISEEARKLWSEMASADADSAASMPETFSEFRSRWSERVNDAISRLNVAGIDRTTKESCFLEDFSRVNQSNDQASEIVSTILGLKDEFPNQFGAIDRACKSVFDAKGSIGFGDFVAPIAEESATLDVDFKALKDIFDLLVAAATNPEEPQAAMSSVDGGGMKTAAALDNATAVAASPSGEPHSYASDELTQQMLRAESSHREGTQKEETETVDSAPILPVEDGFRVLLDPSSENSDRTVGAHGLAWRLASIDEFRLGECLLEDYGDGDTSLGQLEWCLRVANLASNLKIGGPAGRVETLLHESVVEWSSGLSSTLKLSADRRAIGLLASAAYAYAAIVRPETDVASILGDVGGHARIEQWYDFVTSVQDLRTRYPHVNISQLRTSTERQEIATQFKNRFDEWWQHVENKTFRYSGATELWRVMRGPDELVGAIAKSIRDRNTRELEKIAGSYDSDRAIRKYVDTIESRRRLGQRIIGPALQRLLDELKGAVEIAKDYIAIRSSEAIDLDRREQEQAREIATRLMPDMEALHELLRDISLNETALTPFGIAVSMSIALVDRTMHVFDPHHQFNDTAVVPAIAIERGPLKLLSTMIDRPDGGDLPTVIRANRDEFLKSLRAFLTLHVDSIDVADYLQQVENYDSCRVYLRYVQGLHWDASRLDSLEKTIRERRQLSRQELDKQCGKLEANLERMVIVGAIDDGERERLLVTIKGVQHDSYRSNNYAALRERLQQTERIIEESNNRARQNLASVVAQLAEAGKLSEEELEIIRAELKAGDFMLANERIGLAERGVPFLPRKKTDIFTTFYDNFLKDIDDDWKGLPSLVGLIKAGKTYRGLQYPQLSKEQTQRGTALLERWIEASRARNGKEKGFESIVQSIASTLGFSDVVTEAKRSSNGKRFLLKCKRIEGREQCPVPAYGSEADGRYQLLCIWDRPTESDIANAVGDTMPESPVIVFHFGGVNHYRRASLSQVGRSRRRRFIVIDDYMIAFLSAQEASYLSVMFRLSLPFAFLEPFTTSAGTVPPEMFYGRSAEIESIIDPLGSSFIFGGRQLGKTALLKEVRRKYHRPGDGRVAIYLDLERDIVDKSRVYEDFWSLVRKRLAEIDVIRTLPTHTRPDTVIEHLRRWLDDEEGRRLLLLVDEADRFLEHDSRIGGSQPDIGGSFAETRRLQQVMNDTNRRFKVVFAGLHQVQRVTKDVNQPLAHLGQPLQIGPLNRKPEDLQDALALVREPLLNVGYHLDDETALKVLTEANYYPSLIQLYGKALVGSLNRGNVWKDPQSRRPRYNVESDKIDSIRVDHDLQSQIRDRFRWTLQLDPRYEFTANVIAWETLDDRRRLTSGFSPSEIQMMARDWWPAGFANVGVQDMAVLLLEMEGLGVLRSDASTGRFSLRNQSLLGLIGSSAEIETFLLGEHGTPAEYVPAKYRKEFIVDGQPFLAPLADGEIAELLRAVPSITIITGGPLSEFRHVGSFLSSISSYVDRLEVPVTISGCHTAEDFKEALAREVRQAKPEDQFLSVVPAEEPWSLRWIDIAAELLGRYKERPLHIIFLADHVRLWQLIEDADGGLAKRLERSRARIWPRRSWGGYELTQLKNVLRRGWSDKQMEQLQLVTSGWAAVIEYALPGLAGGEQDNWDAVITRIADMRETDNELRRVVEGSYRSIPIVGKLYDALREYGEPLRAAEVQELIDVGGPPDRNIEYTIEWGQLLGDFEDTAEGDLRLNQTIAAFLSPTVEL